MINNSNLHNAKKAKNDEFYTRYEDIEKEIQHYDLSGKTVYCPCDDFRWSNFVRYFKTNYHRLHLSGLLASNYDIGEGAYKYRYDGNVEVYVPTPTGDFLSPETDPMLAACDIVITNPPFSKWREMFKRIMDSGKGFLLIGNVNAITYKDVFPYLKNCSVSIGHTSPKKFEGRENQVECRWFTTLSTEGKEPLVLTQRYSPEKYPKYDNYDAIEVSRLKDIPVDYERIMGVPISFLDKYCPEQFEIVGLDRYVEDNPHYGHRFTINSKETYARIIIRKRK